MSSRSFFIVGAVVLSAVMSSCANPVSRFTKQYKCQIAGKEEPQNAYEYVERGFEHARANELDCAFGACSEAIRLDSKRSAGYACRGGVLWQQQKFGPALQDLNQALNLEPGNGDYYYKRGQIHARMEHPEPAIEDLTRAVELISSELGRSVAYAGRASLYHKQGKLDEAIRDYSDAIKLAPNFAYHYDNRGEVYFEKHDYQQAVVDYTAAIARDGKNQYFYQHRAEAYRKLDRIGPARADEQSAQAIANGPPP